MRPPLVTGPAKPFVPSLPIPKPSIVEFGLEFLGVPSGVPVGVEDALSTLAFLELDLGVIFELRNAFTGVSISSVRFGAMKPACSVLESLLSADDTVGAGDSASLGRRGPLPANCGEFVSTIGRPLLVLLWFVVELPMPPGLGE